MGGKQFSISSFDEMSAAAKKLQNASETYKSIYNQLMQEANTMGTAWEGADNLAFVEQINGFTEELSMMAQKLADASQALEKQKANYVNRQDNNITQVKRLKN